VRLAFALASPLFPLLVLLCCSVLEVISRGTGIAAALQAGGLGFLGLRFQRPDKKQPEPASKTPRPKVRGQGEYA